MKYKKPTNSNGEHDGFNKAPVNQSTNEFYPFDVLEITSSEADEVETYYANRYKWA